MFGFWYYPIEEGDMQFAVVELLRLEDKLASVIEKEDYDEVIYRRISLNIKAIKYYYTI